MYRRYQRRILVIDDEAAIRSLLKGALEPKGFKVDIASDRETAFGLWQSNSYGLVITDLVLRESSDDVDMVHLMRNTDKGIPILAMTGYGQLVAQDALDAGADHVLLKPFKISKLLQVVERLID